MNKPILYVDSKYTSPYAMSVFVVLKEKGIPFDMQTVDLAAEEHYELEYANLSLTCRVPTLVHDGFHLSESSAIDEYLEDMFPAPEYPAVYPADPLQKARARQIQAWIRSDFLPIREERSTETVFLKPTREPLSHAAQVAVKRLYLAADSLLQEGALNLFGQWTIADTDLAVMLYRLIANGDEVPEKLVNYARHQWQRESVGLWVDRVRDGF